MLLVVADEVPEREAVVAGDEVDGVARKAVVPLIEVGTAANAGSDEGGEAGVAAPEAANVVAVVAVPLGPAATEGEAADLIQPGGIPRLGDQLRVREYAVFGNAFDHRRLDHHVPFSIPPQNTGEVEAKPIDVHVADPVAEAGHDEVADDGMVAVDGVADAGEVEVPAAIVEEVVEFVVEAAEGVGAAAIVAFTRVVEDDVENDFEPGSVEGLHHIAELVNLAVVLGRSGQRRLRCGERDRVVTPEVGVFLAAVRVEERAIAFVPLEDGHQFDGRDAEFLQVRNFLDESGVGAAPFDAAGGIAGEAANVDFVDHGVFERGAGRVVFAPVVARTAMVEAAPRGAVRVDLAGAGPGGTVRDHRGGRVEQQPRRVEAVHQGFGAGRSPAVAERFGKVVDGDVPVVASLVLLGVEVEGEERLAAAFGR